MTYVIGIYQFLFRSHNFFVCKISVVNRKEPEPQFLILAPAPGGNLISALGSGTGSTTLAEWKEVHEIMCFIPFIVSSTRRGEICEGQHIPDNTNKFTYFFSRKYAKKSYMSIEQLPIQGIKKNAYSENSLMSLDRLNMEVDLQSLFGLYIT